MTNIMDYVRNKNNYNFRVIWGKCSDVFRRCSDDVPTNAKSVPTCSDDVPTMFRRPGLAKIAKIKVFAYVSLYLSHFDIKHTFDATCID